MPSAGDLLRFNANNQAPSFGSVSPSFNTSGLLLTAKTSLNDLAMAADVRGGRKYQEWYVGGNIVLHSQANIAGASLARTVNGTPVDGTDSDGWVSDDRTGAVTNQLVAVEQSGFPGALWQRRNHLYCVYKVKFTLDITDLRFWFALSTDTATNHAGSNDPAGSHHMGVYWNPAGASANFIFATKDGTTQGTTDSGVAVALGTLYILEMGTDDSDNCWFRINGGAITTRTTNLPGLSTALSNPLVVLRTLENVDKGMKPYWFRVETD